MSETKLEQIAINAGVAIQDVQAAERLINETYGAGCVSCGSHPDAQDIRHAARTLIVHLSLLKARAVNLSLMVEASESNKKKFSGFVL